MAKALKTLIVFFALSAFMSSTGHAAAQFSADLVVLCQGAKPLSGRIFVKGDKVREEVSGPYGSQILIFRPDMKVTWMITGGGKVCLQMPYSPSDNKFEPWTSKKSAKALFLGIQTVFGMPCSKYQIVEDGQKTVYWISSRLSFPLRVDSQYETAECKNVRQTNLADSLFKIPAACGKAITSIAPAKE